MNEHTDRDDDRGDDRDNWDDWDDWDDQGDEGRDDERDDHGGDEGEPSDPAGRRGSRQGGGITIGFQSGGAVAAGERASAESRTRRPLPPPTGGMPAIPAMPAQAGPGGVSVGWLSDGAVVAGPDARAVDAAPLPVPAELLTAVRDLRGDLRLLAPTEETAEVDTALAEVEEEIDGTGRAERWRLEWLRDRLSAGATAAAGLASAVTVAQGIAQLLG
ncbi:hypothetical protein [Streptomyces sp. URMC 123]|uniref:hypothetical protein n=1 Tax=Streptomyces sp. URMC 123 TaxID=3423403 RepID=UPI003F19EB90